MRTVTGKLIADLNDNQGAFTTASLPDQPISLTNENETVYRLFPYELNDPPIFTTNIYDASSPKIVSDISYSPAKTDVMYYDQAGTVKVLAGTSFVFRVEARQPNVLNVENGIPVVIELNRELRYEWLKDNQLVFDTEPSFLERKLDTVKPNNNELVFSNVSARMAGRYTCIVSNDIGEVTSEAIDLVVLTPNVPEDPYFRVNLVQNGFALDSTNNWSIGLGDVTTKPFANELLERELKTPNTSVFAHTPNEIYPHPSNIRTNAVRGFRVADLLEKNASYFTRDSLQYVANGGTEQAVMYQDIDLTEITDYISGRAYGCGGVRAYFGCVIGNAISRFIPTVDLIGPGVRYKSEYYYMNAPRLSYENFVLTGPGLLEESVTVTIQEYEGATALPSIVYENGETKQVPCIQITDTLSDLAQQSSRFNESVNPPFTGSIRMVDGVDFTPVPLSGQNARVLNIYNELYPSRYEYYSYGQYAEYKDSVIRVLNPRTNKIRVSIKFGINTSRQLEINPTVTANDMADLQPSTKPYYKLVPKEFYKDVNTLVKQSNSEEYSNKPFSDIAAASVPRPMVSSLGLVLEPLTDVSVNIDSFRSNLIVVADKQQEMRPKPVNAFSTKADFKTTAQNTSGLSSIFDIQGATPIYYWRKYNDAKGTSTIFNQQEYNHDDETLRGWLTISNVSTGEQYHRTDETHTDLSIQPGGLQTIRIIVDALGRDPDGDEDQNWRDQTYPWLTILTANETSLFDAGGPQRHLHLWPSLVSTTPANIAFFQHDAPVPTTFYETGNGISAASIAASIFVGAATTIFAPLTVPLAADLTTNALNAIFNQQGVPTTPFSGASLPQPRGVGGNFETSRLARRIEVDVPSNQVAAIYAGLRINDNGRETVNDTMRMRMEFQNGSLVYYRY